MINIYSILILFLMLVMPTANSLEMTENINVKGGGALSARTDADGSIDGLNAIGDQIYSRSFSIGDDSSHLETTYVCKNISKSALIIINRSRNGLHP